MRREGNKKKRKKVKVRVEVKKRQNERKEKWKKKQASEKDITRFGGKFSEEVINDVACCTFVVATRES